MKHENRSPASDDALSSPKLTYSSSKNSSAIGRPVKRRASKACQCCRARKVRCNVVEHGAPCTNCRLDEVECVVTESKRRKKHHFASKPLDNINEQFHQHQRAHGLSGADALANGSVNPIDITNPTFRRSSESSGSINDDDEQLQQQHHVPHALYRDQTQKLSDPTLKRTNFIPPPPLFNLLHSVSIHGDLTSAQFSNPPDPPLRYNNGPLPQFIKPLPQRMSADDIQYLWKKGALTIPDAPFRNALLQAYVEYVYPYMPLIDIHDFLGIVDRNDGEDGKISLLLFQAVMFAGTAFVDKAYLVAAGYPTRKAARKAFYLKARLLYDFDYEIDRVALVSSLLLMTYWYETPDDQKDTWHWMGVAISLAHTIGLHRNPEKSNMDIKKQRLWKRIWWSCFMRDRLIALGMRRPTRIKDEDFDVPMLRLEDFELEPLASDNLTISPDCVFIRDVSMQEDLAKLCIAKAKLCLIISHVLSAQYSVLVRDQGTAQGQEGNTRSSVMLFPKKLDQTDEVKLCDQELTNWVDDLGSNYCYRTPTIVDLKKGRSTFVVQTALLHMVYFATVSALHRPQVLPTVESAALQKCRELQDVSRKKVREASREITRMSLGLHNLNLERYLPTTGVTVLLPAIIIHLLDIKSCSDTTRDAALQGFCQCMLVLEKLRDNYAAADYAIQFLEAAIRKADLDISREGGNDSIGISEHNAGWKALQPKKVIAQNVSQLIDAGRAVRLTPPPDRSQSSPLTTETMQVKSTTQIPQPFASTPPGSDSSNILAETSSAVPDKMMPIQGQFDEGFDALIDYSIVNFDGMEDWNFALEEGMHGESGGFMMDMDWMKDTDNLSYDLWGQQSPSQIPYTC